MRGNLFLCETPYLLFIFTGRNDSNDDNFFSINLSLNLERRKATLNARSAFLPFDNHEAIASHTRLQPLT